MKKIIFYFTSFVIAVSIIWFIKFAFFPTGYRNGDWMEPFDRHLRKFDFANYKLPEEYEMVTYRWSHTTEYNKLLLFKRKISGQLLNLVMFREHPNVNFNDVRFENDEPKRPFWSAERDPARGNFFAIWHYLPFAWRDDIENAGNDLTIKGIEPDLDSREIFSTEKTDVLFVRGKFDKLGFYKKSKGLRPYITPVLDFMGPRNGAIAIIKDKKTGKTLFAVGCNYVNQPFNEQEFKDIVKSLALDATPLPGAFAGIKGMTKKTTVTL